MREFEHADNVDPIHLTFVPDKIEALVALDDLERAERLAELMRTMGERFGRPPTQAAAERSRGAILAARGDLDAAEAACHSALAHLAVAPLPLEVARTLLLLGQIERRRKQRARARVTLERSLAVCEEVGAKVWAERVRAELARLGDRRLPSELTASELRVADLAASGLTNREIAATAFMSQKTVEANLSRIYRKLGIRSRAQIALNLPERPS
jgi:DNA-binding NarL/FixJ family response regulator